MFAINIENLKPRKYHTFLKNSLDLTIFYSANEYKKIFTEEGSIEILKILGLITNVDEY